MNTNHNSFESDHARREHTMTALKQLLYADETTAYGGGLDLSVVIDPITHDDYGDIQRVAVRYDTPDDDGNMPEMLDVHMYGADDESLFSYIVTRGDANMVEVMIETLNSQMIGIKMTEFDDLIMTQDLTDSDAQFGFLPEVRSATSAELDQLDTIIAACREKVSFPPTA